MEPITALRDPLLYLPQWADNKLLQAYRQVRPWCQLILEGLNPNFQRGRHRGIALMFPMEKLFEAHVATCLNERVRRPWRLQAPAASEYLVTHQPEGSSSHQDWFNLQPDLMLSRGGVRQVLDTKWKLLEQHLANRNDKYGLSQPDFYQLFAYGQKYQAGVGDMMLIYPKHGGFEVPLPQFYFDKALRLWAIPFCIEQDQLVRGDWETMFRVLTHTVQRNLVS